MTHRAYADLGGIAGAIASPSRGHLSKLSPTDQEHLRRAAVEPRHAGREHRRHPPAGLMRRSPRRSRRHRRAARTRPARDCRPRRGQRGADGRDRPRGAAGALATAVLVDRRRPHRAPRPPHRQGSHGGLAALGPRAEPPLPRGATRRRGRVSIAAGSRAMNERSSTRPRQSEIGVLSVERRRLRRTEILLGATAVLLALALVAGGTALVQRSRARRNAVAARASASRADQSAARADQNVREPTRAPAMRRALLTRHVPNASRPTCDAWPATLLMWPRTRSTSACCSLPKLPNDSPGQRPMARCSRRCKPTQRSTRSSIWASTTANTSPTSAPSPPAWSC